MRISLPLLIFGVIHVLGLRKFVGQQCAKVVFLIDASGSIREKDPSLGLTDPGYLPEIKTGVSLFAQSIPTCTCLEIALFTFASAAYPGTNGMYLPPSALNASIAALDYPHDPICDDLHNYINTDTDFNQPGGGSFQGSINGVPHPLSECLDNHTFFQEQALLYSNYCGRVNCERSHEQGFCGAYPVCDFTNFEAAFYAAIGINPNYAILITDGDPTIINGTYPDCPGPDCAASFCPMLNPCTDPIDYQKGKDAAQVLKDMGAKVITVTRADVVSPVGIINLLDIASCPVDNVPICTDAQKINHTFYVAANYSQGLQDVLIQVPRLAICNTNSPTTSSPTHGPTNSPTFKVSEAPSIGCCDCTPTPTTRYLDTLSPTPGRCTDTSCPPPCVCLPDNVTIGVVDTIPNGKCFNRLCLDRCTNETLFGPTPVTSPRPTRAPTPKRNIFLWLLPFLLGLSGGGGGGFGRPQAPNTVIDVFHIIHSSPGRRLLVACGSTTDNCPNKNTYRCLNNLCVPLPTCTHSDNCTSTTYCDTGFKVCRAKGFLQQECANRPCIDGLVCFFNPDRLDFPPVCTSESCIKCCECGFDPETTTCSPTPALAPGVVFNTKTPTTHKPTKKFTFNPWLLLFLFPRTSNRYPITTVRPGGNTVIDIIHIIHARQVGFNASAGNKECTMIQVGQKWMADNGADIGSSCASRVANQGECCAACKSAPTCVAWEFNSTACLDPQGLASCRLISQSSGANTFSSSKKESAPSNVIIGFIDSRPLEIMPCTDTVHSSDCWNPGATSTDQGDGRQWCSDLDGLEPLICRTICSADNTCIKAATLDYCWKTGGQNGEFGFCVAGGEHCVCNPSVCTPGISAALDPKCCATPLTCCPGTGPETPPP
jgi:hypothetical protein